MSHVGTVIYQDFKRPSPTLIEKFRQIPVANIDDCMGRMAAVSHQIKAVGKSGLCGPAFTVKVPQGDNLMLHKALDLAQPGDVLVVDAGGYADRSIMGDLMARYARLRRLGGIVIDGSIRDCDELAQLDLAIYARGVTPNGPYKNGPGEINTPIVCGGRPVFPGDIVVGDGDGLLVIRPEEAPAVLVATKQLMAKEADIIATQERDGTYLRPWVDEKLKELGYTVFDRWEPSAPAGR